MKMSAVPYNEMVEMIKRSMRIKRDDEVFSCMAGILKLRLQEDEFKLLEEMLSFIAPWHENGLLREMNKNGNNK